MLFPAANPLSFPSGRITKLKQEHQDLSDKLMVIDNDLDTLGPENAGQAEKERREIEERLKGIEAQLGSCDNVTSFLS